ncbi:putative metal-dependent hydrolase [Staphylococcus simiae]|uniref:YfiT family bacillithiol transferase n=1 Tax=Staphylococcus simiae TaxID=308354 RepID=UPI001A96463F|nr:putative metal-dependent hydrolase [Staphylococcus simiae]MBO1199970.1 putative metal-dependent hydrolase [Staphylococcus simiae]MBO1202244.1 putative metal-dependent hydrolase [Staphylococcus simiae]MBO1204499.1 putative metal-dependent hydrolase [Staphylococcus simiae]MBO1212082.1 putative metal-dependent hydrolase [Staphylococcus simiae]MBO1230675.1 putative metal-dependent hydrolase [Staphylococcus simiae]
MDVRFPIGQLQVPQTITQDHLDAWSQDIEEYTKRLQHTVENIKDNQLQSTYRPGAWTVQQLVHHIADSQLNMYQRLKLALTDANPEIPPFDQNQWVLMEDYDLPIDISIQLLEALNQRIVAVIKDIDLAQLDRTFKLKDEGTVTVGETIAKLSWHENHHLAHINIALNQ